jgi:dihydroflavonol-4-reductase
MILVTGATGLLGSHLILKLLEQGQNVKALYRDEKSKKNLINVFEFYDKPHLLSHIVWCLGDILDVPSLSIAFQEVDYVYHCAAHISFDRKDENRLRKTNIEGTANIVNFCLDFKIKKLCHVSSIAALGDLKETETTLDENTEWNPEKSHSDYAISKYGAEMEAWRGQQEGLNVVIVNPGVILGPLFFTQSSGAIYQKIKKGLPFYTKGKAGFVTVIDVVNVMIGLMESKIQSERFILISENKTYQEIAFLIADVLRVKRPQYYAYKWMINYAVLIDRCLSFVLDKKRTITRDLANSLYSTDLYSNKKIAKILKYQFQGIEAYLSSLKPVKNDF